MKPLRGSIMQFGGNFEPKGWASCNGQSLGPSQVLAPFLLRGTTCGGDGTISFRLPDLRGRGPVHAGSGAGLSPRSPGEAFGGKTVTRAAGQVPPLDHDRVVANVASASDRRQGDMPAWPQIHSEPGGPTLSQKPPCITLTKGGQPHGNMPPSLCVTYIIAPEGIHPSRN